MATTNACPICSRHFRAENLALHVEACLQKSSTEERRQKRALELAAPLFPLASPPPPPLPTTNRTTNSGNNNAQASAAAAQREARRHSFPSAASSLATNEVHTGNDAFAVPPPPKKRKRVLPESSAPLAERMRPTSLTDLVGQDELLGPKKLLTSLIEADRAPNMILWGPPGCGKTTLAHVIAKRTASKFLSLSGATSNLADIKDAIERARGERKLLQRRTTVFVDEIHRFKKNVQDVFLPAVEDGTITLIGATTENPSFEINNALLSRCRVYVLQKHSPASIRLLLVRALADPAASGLTSLVATAAAATSSTTQPSLAGASTNNGLDANGRKSTPVPPVRISADDDALEYLARQSGGDARIALNCLEMAVQTAPCETSDTNDSSAAVVRITAAHVRHCFAHRQTLFYDRKGDFHYDLISAFHKSIRGSDANATLYWLARMLEGGESPLYVARRMIRVASEDVGLAAPELLPLAVAAHQAAHFVGMPECDVVLAQCATMLARAPKSVEVYKTYKRVKQTVREWANGAQPDVPLHLRNAPTQLMRDLAYGKTYKYNPDYAADDVADQTYLPDELLGTDFFADANGSRVDNEEDDDEEQ